MFQYSFITILFCCCFLFSCTPTPKDQENSLVPYILKPEESNSKIKLSEIITKHYRVIPLETQKTSLVGSINKIIKQDSIFYVLSNERKIQTFNFEGKYLSTLDKMGRGPGNGTNHDASNRKFPITVCEHGEIFNPKITAHEKLACGSNDKSIQTRRKHRHRESQYICGCQIRFSSCYIFKG